MIIRLACRQMFSIFKDVIAVPDITTLNTHHKLGISGYTYRLDHSCRFSGGFVYVHLVECRSMTTLTAHLLEPSSLDHGELLLASGFGGSDGYQTVMLANDQ